MSENKSGETTSDKSKDKSNNALQVAGLEINDLDFSYGDKRVLRGLTLTAKPGEIAAIMGDSGSGKSTLFRLIAGFEEPDAGEIYLAGENLAGIPAHKRGVVMMFQDKQLFENMTVLENVAFPLKLRGVVATERAERARDLLEAVRLSDHIDKRVNEISGGQQQRVALARSLAADPKLLLLDEPFASLDDSLRTELAKEVRDTLKQQGITTLIITHDADEAGALADTVYKVQDGALSSVNITKE
ncbi:MAG: ABC transporter ATP-binding protein [Microbacteriaceae bacterium]|nr:ABC transporter ATP-binding protein [Microbacteriaceae bacterium]